jgi:hypothetical protein
LESPIVILDGFPGLFQVEQSIRLPGDEREELIRDITRKIYMASIRAGLRKGFTNVGDLPKVMKQIYNT